MNRGSYKLAIRFVRSCHHSRRLEEYQVKGVHNKLNEIGKRLVDINNELKQIGNFVGLDKKNEEIDNKVCNKCMEELNYICTICGNIRK